MPRAKKNDSAPDGKNVIRCLEGIYPRGGEGGIYMSYVLVWYILYIGHKNRGALLPLYVLVPLCNDFARSSIEQGQSICAQALSVLPASTMIQELQSIRGHFAGTLVDFPSSVVDESVGFAYGHSRYPLLSACSHAIHYTHYSTSASILQQVN